MKLLRRVDIRMSILTYIAWVLLKSLLIVILYFV